VTFKNGTTVIGTATLNSGIAILKKTKLPAGTLTITATYNGDAESAKSSGSTTQVIGQATNNTTLRSSLNPSTVGEAVTFIAKVSSATSVPVVSVTFMDGSSTLGTIALAGGKASYTTSALSAGLHSITALYAGTANILGSTSPILTQTVH